MKSTPIAEPANKPRALAQRACRRMRKAIPIEPRACSDRCRELDLFLAAARAGLNRSCQTSNGRLTGGSLINTALDGCCDLPDDLQGASRRRGYKQNI